MEPGRRRSLSLFVLIGLRSLPYLILLPAVTETAANQFSGKTRLILTSKSSLRCITLGPMMTLHEFRVRAVASLLKGRICVESGSLPRRG